MTETVTIRNGIDVDQLQATIAHVQDDAAAQGIDITRMDYEIEGDIDLHDFLGQQGPRPGFTEIRATGTVSSPNASEEQLTALCQYVQDTSPVRDVLANATPVHTTLRVV